MAVFINKGAARCATGLNWNEVWQSQLLNRIYIEPFSKIQPSMNMDALVSFDRWIERDLEDDRGVLIGSASRMAIDCTGQLLQSGAIQDCLFYGGSTHNEADIMMAYARHKCGIETFSDYELLTQNLFIETIPHAIANTFKQLKINCWVHSSCVSSLHAMAMAVEGAKVNEKMIHLVLGVDTINAIEVAGFEKVGAITKRGCRPFEVDRDGILIGEGAAGIILSAQRIGDAIEIAGVGMACDAADATNPNGVGLREAIGMALEQAEISATCLGAVVLHGTGTKSNDAIELEVLAALLAGAAVPCTSIKGVIGHTMGAAGMFNILTGVQVLKSACLPPLMSPLSYLMSGLTFAAEKAIEIDVSKPILVLASGFGGNNVAIILRQ